MRKGGTIPSYAIVRAFVPGTPRSERYDTRPRYVLTVLLFVALLAVALLSK